jgi:hypothetical protein
MTLTTAADYDLNCDDLETICELGDDVYRNQWITFAYHKISQRTRRYIGDDATWCTFARWSSYTVGRALDLEVESSRLDQMLTQAHVDATRFSWVHARLQELNRDLRRLSDSAMPRTLAIGNHYVFHDIAHSMTRFLEWYEENAGIDASDKEAWDEAWTTLLPRLRPLRANDLFQDADIELLTGGLRHYLDAIRNVDGLRSQHILHGNVLLAVYEQWRLDPILKLALDPVAKSLVEFHNRIPTHNGPDDRPQAVLRRRGTRWALRHQSSIRRWIADQYGQYLTQVWLTYEAPLESSAITPLVVGKGFRGHRRRRADDVTTDEESELFRLLSIYDHNRRMRGSASWTRFADRMQFIVDLFREHASNRHLHQPPSPSEMAMLRLDISDAALNALRFEGDDEADQVISTALAGVQNPPKPRDLVAQLVQYGWGREDGVGASERAFANRMLQVLGPDLPDWVEPEKIKRGQQFLERYAFAIAAALFNGSLPKSYTIGHGTKVLTATADLASGNVNRRIAETGQLLLDLMEVDEHPLEPGTLAGDAARGVRLFHAAVRRMLETRGWDPQLPAPEAETPAADDSDDGEHGGREELPPRGRPINQEDMIGTLVAFTVLVVDALDEMGIKVSKDDREAYVHLWQAVGWLLGIDYEGLHRAEDPPEGGLGTPPDLAQLRVIGRAIYRRNSATGPDGQVLTAALMQMMRDSWKKWWLLHSVPSTTTRWLLGDETADFLALPPAEAPARVFLRASRPFLRLASVGRVGGAPAAPVRLNARRMYQDWVNTYKEDRVPWRVPDSLKKKVKYPDGGASDRRAGAPPPPPPGPPPGPPPSPDIDLTDPSGSPTEPAGV